MAGKTSKSQEGYYSQYKSSNRWKSNRERKLERALKLSPDNKQIIEALANLKYRRRTPTTRQWPSRYRREAQLLKLFSGRCPPQVFSSNPKVAAEALHGLWREHQPGTLPDGKVSFKLGDRI